MKSNRVENWRSKMKLVNGILGMTIVLALWVPATRAQTQPAAANQNSVQTFYLTNVNESHEVSDVVNALRNMLDPNDKIYVVPLQNAIFVSAPPDQLLLAQKLLKDLDRPKKTYRLTYTIAEIDDGKRVGNQHFAVTVVSGGKTVFKNGSKVPIVTGTSATSKTEVTYVDLGLNIDASLDESASGVRLRTKVERSSIAEEKATGVDDPVIRQMVIEGTAILIPGKQVTLGSLDIPGSTRHLEVEVVLEVLP
jgi:type II secretory pathway component GspD/PulD (secretin)